MSDLTNFYYNKWIEKVEENKKLKLEIEQLNKIRDYNSNFKDKMMFYEREIRRYERAIKKYNSYLKRMEKYYLFYKKVRDVYKEFLLYGTSFKVTPSTEKQKDIVQRINIFLHEVLKK